MSNMKVMDHEDLCVEVLKRLPIKRLCRFRSVCKSWNSFISSTSFINSHLSLTNNFYSTHDLIKPYLDVRTSPQLRERVVDCNSSHLTVGLLLHYPFRVKGEEIPYVTFTYVDVIHGVVCISFSRSKWIDDFGEEPPTIPGLTLLWNPIIHKYLPLPRPIIPTQEAHDHVFHAIGFGYNSTKNDFKVVMIVTTSGKMSYHVYSSRQGVWRNLVTTIASVESLESEKGCFLNGTIYWFVSHVQEDGKYKVDLLLMFDCESDELSMMELQLPEEYFCSPLRTNRHVLFRYSGMLAALCIEDYMEECADLWVMDEYGVWNMLYKQIQDHHWTFGYVGDEPMPHDGFESGELTIYKPNLASRDANMRWFESYYSKDLLDGKILRHYVYEETMFLMDHPKAQSYMEDELVLIRVPI